MSSLTWYRETKQRLGEDSPSFNSPIAMAIIRRCDESPASVLNMIVHRALAEKRRLKKWRLLFVISILVASGGYSISVFNTLMAQEYLSLGIQIGVFIQLQLLCVRALIDAHWNIRSCDEILDVVFSPYCGTSYFKALLAYKLYVLSPIPAP